MNWPLDFFIRKQIVARESDLKLAQSSHKHAVGKEEESLNEGKQYQYGYWFGMRSSYEDEIRRINREIEFLKSELKESVKDGSLRLTV
jgi:hypothetical protein